MVGGDDAEAGDNQEAEAEAKDEWNFSLISISF